MAHVGLNEASDDNAINSSKEITSVVSDTHVQDLLETTHSISRYHMIDHLK